MRDRDWQRNTWTACTLKALAERGGGSVTVPLSAEEQVDQMKALRKQFSFHIVDDESKGTRTVEARPL